MFGWVVSSEKLAAVHINKVPRNMTIVFADLSEAQNQRVLKALKLRKFPSGSFAFAISYTKNCWGYLYDTSLTRSEPA